MWDPLVFPLPLQADKTAFCAGLEPTFSRFTNGQVMESALTTDPALTRKTWQHSILNST